MNINRGLRRLKRSALRMQWVYELFKPDPIPFAGRDFNGDRDALAAISAPPPPLLNGQLPEVLLNRIPRLMFQ